MIKVFIDGSSGTTGLRIKDRLSKRNDIELISLSDEDRHSTSRRSEALSCADVAFLCLPDAAAIEAVSLTKSDTTVIIDASTAHRTMPEWAYGFPELSLSHKEKIQGSNRIAVPGCHAGGFIALVYPLIEAGLLQRDVLLTCHSLTGYSGGGKAMISQYENEKTSLLCAPRQYGLSQQHKHLKEMQTITGLSCKPIFSPIVCDFYSGMEVSVPIFSKMLNNASVDDIKQVYAEKYQGPIVGFCDELPADGFLSAATLSATDSMKISVFGNDERIMLTAVYDNLGKGASGAAIECMNIRMGLSEAEGLDLAL